MKVLITGVAGFVGSRLASKLIAKNHEVFGLVHENPPTISEIKVIKGDLSKPDFEIPDEDFDVVFHLAALTPMEKNKKKNKKVNFEGTINLFNKIKSRTKFLVYVSGLGAFGDPGEKIIDENTPLNPNTDYTKMRLEAQKFLEKNCKDNSIPFSVAYLGEVYGNGGWFTTQIVSRLKKGNFRLPKAGDYYRCYVHVDDVADSLVAIAEKQLYNESFVITDSNPALFKEFINYTCDKLGVKHPGNVPTFLAKTVMGGDFVKLLTTSIKTSNEKISKVHPFKYPSYKEGIESFISEIK